MASCKPLVCRQPRKAITNLLLIADKENEDAIVALRVAEARSIVDLFRVCFEVVARLVDRLAAGDLKKNVLWPSVLIADSPSAVCLAYLRSLT